MAIGVATGGAVYGGGTVPQLSGGAGQFIPELWSAKLIEKFYDATVFGAIANTDYEGEIKKMGDTVHIRTRPTLTIRDYVKGQTLAVERPDSVAVELTIDRAKYFNAVEDDIDKTQTDLNLMNLWSTDAGEQMKLVIDRDILGSVYADAAATNKGATAGRISGNINLGATGAPLGLTKANVLEWIVDLGTVLDEQNIPEQGRFLVIPAWLAGMIKKSDLKDVSITGDSVTPLRNGLLGTLDRFTVYTSHGLHHAVDATHDSFDVIAGHKMAITFASQMTNMESLRSEQTFGSLIRGLQVYGFEVIKPEALVWSHVYKA